jgi:hypothetical protein
VEVVADGPHSMYFERPELFNHSLDLFLRRTFAARGVAGSRGVAG